MQENLNKFEKEADDIVTSFSGSIGSKPQPSIIYHYTNDVGLKGILETGKIWLTDAFSLNDPSEMRHGFSILVKILESKAKTKQEKCFAKLIHNCFNNIQKLGNFFICSFSENGDDLGQWRAYADDGLGYALGFDRPALETPFASQDCGGIPNCSTFPVTYDDDKLGEIQQQIVDRMFGLISTPVGMKLPEEILRAYWHKLFVLLTTRAMHASLYFKHCAYRNEQEYRFLQLHPTGHAPTDMKLRAHSYSLIKYLEFDWKSANLSALKQIIVGPASNRPEAQRFAEDCVDMFYRGTVPRDKVPIVHSKIPYRAT